MSLFSPLLRAAKALFLSFFFLLFGAFTASASHYMGGVINYKCLGSGTYEVSVFIYRDCYDGINLDPSISLSAKLLGTNIVETFELPLDTLFIMESVATNPCFFTDEEACIQSGVYKSIITLPFNAQGYQLVFNSCCRNAPITNLPPALNQSMVLNTFISAQSYNLCNNSPVLENSLPDFFCLDVPFSYQVPVVDEEGDSLVFSLCNPVSGANLGGNNATFTNMNYLGPTYSLSNIIGNLEDPMVIDPVTGIITGTPTIAGAFQVAVCIKEYRNGVLLSEQRREFQIFAGLCQPAQAVILSNDECYLSDTLKLLGSTSSANTFIWTITPTAGGPSITATGPSVAIPNVPVGNYDVQLIVQVNEECVDTSYSNIDVINLPSDFFNLSVSPSCGGGQNGFLLDITINDPGNNLLLYWEIIVDGPGAIADTLLNPVTSIYPAEQNGLWKFKMLVHMSVGCFQYELETALLSSLTNFLYFEEIAYCGDDNFYLNPLLNGPNNGVNSSYVISWTPTTGLINPTSYNPIVINGPNIQPFYIFEINNGVGCFSDTVFVYELDQSNGMGLEPVYEVCEFPFTVTLPQITDYTFLQWTIKPNIQISGGESHTFNTYPSDTVFILGINSAGCEFRDTLIIVPGNPPSLTLQSSNTPFCGNTFTSTDIQAVTSPLGNYQMTWVLNGQAQGALGNTVTVPFTDNPQLITCQLLNPYGCFKEESLTIPPGIFSDFSVAPTADPPAHAFGGQSNLATNLTGTYSEPVTFSWSPTAPLNNANAADVVADVVVTTTFVVTVTDAEGCTATGSVVVQVFTVCDTPYIALPNAFTPNNDGTNDNWKLLSEVPIKHLDVAVYNRWGNKVFSSNDPQFAWPGKINDVELPSDSYSYVLKATCINGETWESKGDLLLLR